MRSGRPSDSLDRRPAWGVGLSYRAVWHEPVMEAAALIDFLEVPSEDYGIYRWQDNDPGEHLLREAEALPLIAHGIQSSVGSAAPPEPAYLDSIARFVQRCPVSEYSEHCSFTVVDDRRLGCFVAIPRTDLGVAATVANTRLLKRRLGLPVLLENVTTHFEIPGSTLSEAEFLARVTEQADCGVMLDLANLSINSANQGYDPVAFIDGLPSDRVAQAHFCGSEDDGSGYLLDTHRTPATSAVWELMEHALQTTDLRALILERDRRFHAFREVLDELWYARERFVRHRSVRPTDAWCAQMKARIEPPDPEASEPMPAVLGELLAFQRVLVRMLDDPELRQAVDREGQVALKHTGLGLEERKNLAAIPLDSLERLAGGIRKYDHDYALARSRWRARQLEAWLQSEPRA